MMSHIQIKILYDIPGYKAGQVIRVEVNDHGTPLNKFWRRRFKDAKTDNCLEIVKTESKKSSKPKFKSSKSKLEDQENTK